MGCTFGSVSGMRRRGLLAVASLVALPAPALASAAAITPNDTYYLRGDQWGLTGWPASIRAPQAWQVSMGRGVLIADVDTGADFGHRDLAGKLTAGARFTACNGTQNGSGQQAVSDDVGHGTMTTGLMVADTNNGIGIAAVAPLSTALVVKVLIPGRTITGQPTGTGCPDDVAAGIRWAADAGARVINLSIGSDVPLTGTGLTSSIPDAIRYAASRGVAVAAAAGNNSLPLSDYKEIAGVALVAGAIGPDGSVAPYSTNGAGVNIYAPGGDSGQPQAGPDAQGQVFSTNMGGGYTEEEGTSFAAPHAAGTLALLMACGLNAASARQRILDTAVRPQGVPQLDAAAALAGIACRGAGGTGGSPSTPGAGSGGPSRPGTALLPGAPATPHAAGAATSSSAATTTASPTSGPPSGDPGGAVALARPNTGGGASPAGSGPPWNLVALFGGLGSVIALIAAGMWHRARRSRSAAL